MFPLHWPDEGLQDHDFALLELQFARTITYFLPCASIHFLTLGELRKSDETDTDQGSSWEHSETWDTGGKLVLKERQPVVNEEGDLLFLPIWNTTDPIAVAVLDGGGMTRYSGYALDWLLERSRIISRELRQTKQWAYDPESGLLTGRQLREDIECLLELEMRHGGCQEDEAGKDDGKNEKILGAHWTVFLVEIFPTARNAGQSSGHIVRAGACLNSLLGDLVPICHFGSGLFGMLWSSEAEDEVKSLGYALLRTLKRQKFLRVYVGRAPLLLDCAAGAELDASVLADQILADAWGALREARKLGPFALCSSYSKEAGTIFAPPGPEQISMLKDLWGRRKAFVIICVQRDDEKDLQPLYELLESRLEESWGLCADGRSLFLYMDTMDAEQAQEWGRDVRETFRAVNAATCSMGIAWYPCRGFTKDAIPVNARKALVHTSFLGPGTGALFDSVSLNISGDVYYNEGDLGGAVREYKLGRKLDPNNTNLLNSLAVIYAQVNRYHLAIPLLKRVLEIKPADFMALFNLGFSFLRKNDTAEAIVYFEKALALDDGYFDLLLQLGQLYCETGQFQKAVTVLKRAEGAPRSAVETADGVKDIGRGLVFTSLGWAFQEIGQTKDAIVHLQQAMQYNPMDAEALSRLGELYLDEGEGDEIACSLCRRAVEIDAEMPAYWLRLARVSLKCNDMSMAEDALQHCLGLDRKNYGALQLLHDISMQNGETKQARLLEKRMARIRNDRKTYRTKKGGQGERR